MKRTRKFFGILTIIAGFATLVHAQSFLTDGLVAYYPFNGTANDASGNGNDATLVGQHYFTATGVVTDGDNSQTYNGGGYVSLPPLGSQISDSITVSLWVKVLDFGIGEYPLFFGQDDAGAAHLNIDLLNGFVADDSHGLRVIPFNATSTFGTPELYTMTYTPGTFAGYINGNLIGSVNTVLDNLPLSPGALGWHQWALGTSARSTFEFSDVRIYDRALSDSEVATLYQVEVPEPDSLVMFGLGSFGLTWLLRRKR